MNQDGSKKGKRRSVSSRGETVDRGKVKRRIRKREYTLIYERKSQEGHLGREREGRCGIAKRERWVVEENGEEFVM